MNFYEVFIIFIKGFFYSIIAIVAWTFSISPTWIDDTQFPSLLGAEFKNKQCILGYDHIVDFQKDLSATEYRVFNNARSEEQCRCAFSKLKRKREDIAVIPIDNNQWDIHINTSYWFVRTTESFTNVFNKACITE